MHRYRSHTCGALRESDIDQTARLSGWCHRIRYHGGVLFIDLRDHYGLTQCVVDPDSPAFNDAEKLRSEWVVRMDGKVRRRPDGTDNSELATGAVELYVSEIEVLGPAGELPLPVFGEQEYPENKLLDCRRGRASAEIARMLELRLGESIMQLRRVLYFRGQPVVLDEVSLPGAIFKGLSAGMVSQYGTSLYGLFESEFGTRMIRAEERIRAVPAEGATAWFAR